MGTMLPDLTGRQNLCLEMGSRTSLLDGQTVQYRYLRFVPCLLEPSAN